MSRKYYDFDECLNGMLLDLCRTQPISIAQDIESVSVKSASVMRVVPLGPIGDDDPLIGVLSYLC